MKVMAVFGTRPEAIKMCPLILELERHSGIECVVCLTGQHREMLRQVMEAFGVREKYNLDIMQTKQSLTTVTTAVLERLEPALKEEKPDIVLVHGDTTTSFAAALAAFYQQIPVGHVEAGLRTGNRYSPYPEEMNRTLTGKLATYHFAPTEKNRENLRAEHITQNVFVTGNTVIDAFRTTVQEGYRFRERVLCETDFTACRVIVVTAHRRENLGMPLKHICGAISRLAREYEDVVFVYPLHKNPAVRETVFPMLAHIENVKLTEPLDVLDMHNLLGRCFFVMTDSGGLQEEAPSLGKPVLVMRKETERPEAVEAGTVRVIGTEEESVYRNARLLLDDKAVYDSMARAVNPYGDGHASERIAGHLQEIFGL